MVRETVQSTDAYLIVKTGNDPQYAFVFDGPQGEEMSVPFTDVEYNSHTIQLLLQVSSKPYRIQCVMEIERRMTDDSIQEWLEDHGKEVEQLHSP